MLGIYVHFPFCERKCVYCNFSSFVNKEIEDKYIDHLLNEIQDFVDESKDKRVNSIYFGGGTPSFVSQTNIKRVMDKLRECFVVMEDSEITIECNPHSTTREKLEFYHKLGFNRISFGVQSLNDEELKFLGRLHSSQEGEECIKLAKSVGFKNISADLIIGVKGQTLESLLASTRGLIELGVNHISSYMLQVEEGTPLYKMVKENPSILPDDDESVNLYERLVAFLGRAGFEQYEVSNFAKDNSYSLHNMKYWKGDEYVGFGLGASSYINGQRKTNGKTFEEYFKGEGVLSEILTPWQRIEEGIMLGLRCKCGVKKEYLKSLGYDIEKNENYDFFLKNNVLREENGIVYINKEYFPVNNYIIVKLLP